MAIKFYKNLELYLIHCESKPYYLKIKLIILKREGTIRSLCFVDYFAIL